MNSWYDVSIGPNLELFNHARAANSDLEASEKIKVYDRGISVDPSPENVYQMLVGYRTGDMWAPKLAVTPMIASAIGRGPAGPSVPIDVSRTIETLLESAPFDFVHVHEPFAPSAASMTSLKRARE